jgi:hypothetical protein
MDDMISRADAIRLIRNELDFLGSRDTNAAVMVLQKMPAASAAEWDLGEDGYYCSKCMADFPTNLNPTCYGINFCPNCGAKMK